jgi:hypothetical protein
MWSDIIAAVKDLDFKRLNELLSGIDMLTLLKNPYVIGLMVLCCIIFVIRGMERTLVTFLSVPALVVLFQKTVEGTNALDFDAEKLLVFCGGFIALAAVNIYVYFVRGK